MKFFSHIAIKGVVKSMVSNAGKVLIAVLFALTLIPSYFAQPAEGKDKKPASGREKIISREGRAKVSRDKSKIDFEDESINGVRKTPMASLLNSTKAKKDYDMVPIRTDWRPEMVKSASSLDAGKN